MTDLHNHICTHPPRQSSSAPSPYLPYLCVRFTMRLSGPPQYGLIAAGGRATSVSAKSLGVCFGTTPAYLIKPPPESDDSLVPTRNRRIILLSEREKGEKLHRPLISRLSSLVSATPDSSSSSSSPILTCYCLVPHYSTSNFSPFLQSSCLVVLSLLRRLGPHVLCSPRSRRRLPLFAPTTFVHSFRALFIRFPSPIYLSIRYLHSDIPVTIPTRR